MPAKVLARALTAALVATTLSSSIPAAGQSRAEATAARLDISAIHIDNFGEINPTFYRGAQPKGRDYADLAALGVKTIVNLTSDDADQGEKADAGRNGLKYVAIPMTTHVAPTDAQLAQFLAVVSDPANQPIYVHCVGGRHRTGVMTAAYRMTHDGWSADQAFAEMKRFKFGADFLHAEFKSFVYGYKAPAATVASAVTAEATKTKH